MQTERNPKNNILVIEDDLALAGVVKEALEEQGYSAHIVPDGQVAKNLMVNDNVDLIILDLTLPGADGHEVLQSVRSRNPSVPVLLMSGRSALEERIGCFQEGADDFLPKPFAIVELCARVHAILKRCKQNRILEVNGLRLDLVSRRLLKKGLSVDLTAREFLLLEHMAKKPGHIISRLELLKAVWGMDFDPRTNVVDVYVNYLRKKLDPANPYKYIRTHRNRGYEFAA